MYLLSEELRRAMLNHFALQPWNVANDFMQTLGRLPVVPTPAPSDQAAAAPAIAPAT